MSEKQDNLFGRWADQEGERYTTYGVANKGSADPKRPPTVVYAGKGGLRAMPKDEWLTSMKLIPGSHQCREWDGLLICESDPEYESCHCAGFGGDV